MATLLFGGAFNPLTHGHLLTAREAMEREGFRKVIFIPTGRTQLKDDLAPFEHRLAMLKLAIEGQDGFEVSDWEGEQAKLGKKSYSIDTFRHMRTVVDDELSWLIGSDNLDGLVKWNNFEAVKEEIRFIILRRPGSTRTLQQLRSFTSRLGITGKVIQAAMLDISSTNVRRRIRQQLSVRYLVPKEVEDYIHANGLYGAEGCDEYSALGAQARTA